MLLWHWTAKSTSDKGWSCGDERVHWWTCKEGVYKRVQLTICLSIFLQSQEDGKLCLIMYYWVLNSLTMWDTYPLPLINTILNNLQGKESFTKFNIRWGYNNIQIKEEDQWKAAFTLDSINHASCFLASPIPLPLSAVPWPAYSTTWLTKYPTKLFVYMDDILIATKDDLNHHQIIVDEVLELLAKESYFLQPSKCILKQTQIKYLNLVVNGGSLSIDPTKANGLQDWPRTLTKVKQVCSVLGVLRYQRPFIPNYTSIAKPLTDLTRKDHPFVWTPQCQEALDTLIDIVLSNPSLKQPNPNKPLSLQVDASAFATGAILTQCDHRGKDQPWDITLRLFQQQNEIMTFMTTNCLPL